MKGLSYRIKQKPHGILPAAGFLSAQCAPCKTEQHTPWRNGGGSDELHLMATWGVGTHSSWGASAPPGLSCNSQILIMASTSFLSNSALLFEGFFRNFSCPFHEFAPIVENLHRISWVCFGQSLNGRVPQDTKGQPRLHHLVDCVNGLIITNCDQGREENASEQQDGTGFDFTKLEVHVLWYTVFRLSFWFHCN